MKQGHVEPITAGLLAPPLHRLTVTMSYLLDNIKIQHRTLPRRPVTLPKEPFQRLEQGPSGMTPSAALGPSNPVRSWYPLLLLPAVYTKDSSSLHSLPGQIVGLPQGTTGQEKSYQLKSKRWG